MQPVKKEEAIDIGKSSSSVNANPTCEIKFKHIVEPFSYVTLLTGEDKDHFMKLAPHRWNFLHLTPLDGMMESKNEEKITLYLGTR